MSRWERSRNRDLSFSHWHRSLGDDEAMIDIDCVEYDRATSLPLSITETAYNNGKRKPSTVSQNTARLLSIPCNTILYTTGDTIWEGLTFAKEILNFYHQESGEYYSPEKFKEIYRKLARGR